MTAPNNDNGRVTMAVLATKIDALTELVKEIRAGQQQDHDRIGILESAVAENRRNIERAISEICSVDKSRKWESRIEAILLAGMSVFGIMKN